MTVRYRFRYLTVMPALNLEFTEQEMQQIRDVAAGEGRSMRNFVHDAVVHELHRRRVAAAALRVARMSAGLNRRLENQ